MAIRPVDFQGSIFQATQVAQAQNQAEAAPQTAQAAAAQQFASKIDERQETVYESQHAEGDKVHERREREREEAGQRQQRRPRQPGEPFSEIESSVLAAGSDGEHLIDFSA